MRESADGAPSPIQIRLLSARDFHARPCHLAMSVRFLPLWLTELARSHRPSLDPAPVAAHYFRTTDSSRGSAVRVSLTEMGNGMGDLGLVLVGGSISLATTVVTVIGGEWFRSARERTVNDTDRARERRKNTLEGLQDEVAIIRRVLIWYRNTAIAMESGARKRRMLKTNGSYSGKCYRTRMIS